MRITLFCFFSKYFKTKFWSWLCFAVSLKILSPFFKTMLESRFQLLNCNSCLKLNFLWENLKPVIGLFNFVTKSAISKFYNCGVCLTPYKCKAPFVCLNSKLTWNADKVTYNITLLSMNCCWNYGNDISRIKYFTEGTTAFNQRGRYLYLISMKFTSSVNWIIIFLLIKPMVSSRPTDDQIWSYRNAC